MLILEDIFICPVHDDEFHKVCLTCPLPVCKQDGRDYFIRRNKEVYLYWKRHQAKPLNQRPPLKAIAYKFGINSRQQVWEIIQRENSKVKD